MDSIKKTKTSLEKSTIILLIITWIAFIVVLAHPFLERNYPSLFWSLYPPLFYILLSLAPISVILAIVCTVKGYSIKYLLLSLPLFICSLVVWFLFLFEMN